MRTFEERPNSIEAEALDRLVAGDLPEAERRGLLLQLENDPDGWRRCALAFLEDQTLRQALAPLAQAASTPPFVSTGLAPASSRRAWNRLARMAVAACLLGLGFVAGSWSKGNRVVELAQGERPSPTPAIARPSEIREVGTLELVDDSAGEAPPDRFPIRSGPGLDNRWLRSQPPSVPDYVRARWERQGYQVAERRKLVSVELGDGRQVTIPVDEVEVDYIGQRPL